MDPRRGVAGALRGRIDPVLARRHARHHRSQGSRGEAPVEPRRPASHAAAAPGARAAAAARPGGRTPADRRRHPRRPDPGDERRRHATADAAGICPAPRPPRRWTRSSARSPARSTASLAACSSSVRRRWNVRGWCPPFGIYLEHTARPRGWTVVGARRADVRAATRTWRRCCTGSPRRRSSTRASTPRRRRCGSRSVEAGDGIVVRVIDDGRGFRARPAIARPSPGHLGLSTMVERAELAGGWVRVISAPGRGDDGRVLAPGRHRRRAIRIWRASRRRPKPTS